MATKAKKKQNTTSKMNQQKKKTVVKKERGTILTIVLIIMAIHGIFAAYLYSTAAPEVQRPWIITMMVVHSLLDIAAAVGIYYWKKWGLYVYAASTVLALVAGLLSIGVWSVFYMVLPLAIVGWLLRSKWSYFES